MEKDLISVIIPVYNSKRYLKRSVGSILNQTYKKVEVILVDDGSKDGSGEYCDKLAKKDGRIRVIHQKNSGVSVARNTGIDNAKGEYLSFIDSDDWIKKDGLEILFDSINKENADMSYGDIYHVYAMKCWKAEYSYSSVVEIDGEKEDVFCLGPCAKLYKTSILKENGIRFPVGVKCGEDIIFLCDYMCFAKKSVKAQGFCYYYNRMFEETASNGYYPEYSTWIKGVIEARLKLFRNKRGDKPFSESVKMFIIEWFEICLRNEMFAPKDKRELSPTKLKETYLVFKDYLEEIGDISGFDEIANLYKGFSDYIGREDYQGLLGIINATYYEPPKNNLKNRIKRVIAKIKRFIIFKLNLLYK